MSLPFHLLIRGKLAKENPRPMQVTTDTHYSTDAPFSQGYIPFTDDDIITLDVAEAEYEAWLIARHESEIEDFGVPSIDSIAFAEMARR